MRIGGFVQKLKKLKLNFKNLEKIFKSLIKFSQKLNFFMAFLILPDYPLLDSIIWNFSGFGGGVRRFHFSPVYASGFTYTVDPFY